MQCATATTTSLGSERRWRASTWRLVCVGADGACDVAASYSRSGSGANTHHCGSQPGTAIEELTLMFCVAGKQDVGRDYSSEVLALYHQCSGAVHVVEVAKVVAPERF